MLAGGIGYRGGSKNSLKGGGGGFWVRILRRGGWVGGVGGGGFRVQVRGNFHILTSKKNKTTTSVKGGGG